MTISFHDLSKMTRRAAQTSLLKRTEADLSSYEEKVKPIIEAVRTEGDVALARFARAVRQGAGRGARDCRNRSRFRSGRKDARPEGARGAGIHGASRSAASTRTRSRRKCGSTKSAPASSPVTARRPSRRLPATCRAARGPFPPPCMMTTIPANVAGVKEIAIVTPPGPDGKIDDATLVAARMSGVSESLQGRRRAGHRRRGLWHSRPCPNAPRSWGREAHGSVPPSACSRMCSTPERRRAPAN